MHHTRPEELYTDFTYTPLEPYHIRDARCVNVRRNATQDDKNINKTIDNINRKLTPS